MSVNEDCIVVLRFVDLNYGRKNSQLYNEINMKRPTHLLLNKTKSNSNSITIKTL